MCGALPIREIRRQTHWCRFRRVLCLNKEMPVQLAMDLKCEAFAVEGERKGRPALHTACVVVNKWILCAETEWEGEARREKECMATDNRLKTALSELRHLAADSEAWKRVVKSVCEVWMLRGGDWVEAEKPWCNCMYHTSKYWNNLLTGIFSVCLLCTKVDVSNN